MAELWPFNEIQDGRRRHLGFLTYVNLTVNLAVGPHFLSTYQIWHKYVQKWLNYGQKCDFRFGGGRHLGFCKIWILLVKPFRVSHFLSVCEILCKSVEKWPSYGRFTKFKMAAAAILDWYLPWTTHKVSFMVSNLNVFQGDIEENVSGCFFLKHSVLTGSMWTKAH